jgi:hypothetical protein
MDLWATLDSQEFKRRAKKESVGWFFPKLKDFNFAQHLFLWIYFCGEISPTWH